MVAFNHLIREVNRLLEKGKYKCKSNKNIDITVFSKYFYLNQAEPKLLIFVFPCYGAETYEVGKKGYDLFAGEP